MDWLMDLMQDPARMFGWQGVLVWVAGCFVYTALFTFVSVLMWASAGNKPTQDDGVLEGFGVILVMLPLGMLIGQIAYRVFDAEHALWWLYGVPLLGPALLPVGMVVFSPLGRLVRQRREAKRIRRLKSDQCCFDDLLLVAEAIAWQKGSTWVFPEHFSAALQQVDTTGLSVQMATVLGISEKSLGSPDARQMRHLGNEARRIGVSREVEVRLLIDRFQSESGLALFDPIPGVKMPALSTAANRQS